MAKQRPLKLVNMLPVTAPGLMNERSEAEAVRYLPEGTDVIHTQIEHGALTIECEFEEALSAPEVAKLAKKLYDEERVDGIYVNCFGDPGVRPARELVKIPVLGGFEPAMYLALGLGDQIGIVTIVDNVVPMIRNNIARCGLRDRVACVRVIDMPVLALEDHALLVDNLFVQAQAAILEDRADVIVLGCTGIVGVADELRERLLGAGLDVPVLEGSQCAMALTELYARMGLYPSRRTYMDPPQK